jgi:hypothetical protein
MLFKAVLGIAVRRYKVETLERIFDICGHIVACVDGVVIMGRR